MSAKLIGDTFSDEIRAAGLTGLPFSWGEDGVHFSPQMTADQIAAVSAVVAAHDPNASATPEKSALDHVIDYIASKDDAPAELKAIVAERAELAAAAAAAVAVAVSAKLK